MRSVGVLLAAALTGTGASTDSLVFTRTDGTRIPLPKKVSVFCGPWENGPGESLVRTPSLHVRALSTKRRVAWELDAVLRDIRAGTVVRLPHSPVYDHPTKAVMFVNDGPRRNEASSATDNARGTIRFVSIGCNPARVEIAVDATLGSEFSDGTPVRVRGRFRAHR